MLKFSTFKLPNKLTSMLNMGKIYFRVLEVISFLNFDLECKYRAGRKNKISNF